MFVSYLLSIIIIIVFLLVLLSRTYKPL